MTLTLSAIVGWIIVGLIIGGIAHLLVPGRQRIGIFMTILVGVIGALAGGIITTALLGTGHLIITFIVALVISAVLISAVSHPRSRLYYRRRRSLRR
ncbi:MAG TPA: hypothetical protein VMG38_18700 [Trebonia sp.]|nr:hypothetical protein [Trebonia sp.]